MAVEIIQLSADEVLAAREELVDIYRQALAPPPYNKGSYEVAQFHAILYTHTQLEGFRCVVAREEQDGRFVGFAYGYTSYPGQWWRDLIINRLDQAAITRWFGSSFELAELAVLPGFQGLGIGGHLHDAILRGLPHRSAVLSTHYEETIGQKLYRARGWITLLERFYFPGYSYPYRIMGLELRAER